MSTSLLSVWPGKAYPLGATYDGSGTNFVLISEVAERVELCLFDENGQERRVELPEVTAFCWHGYLPNVRPGQRYSYRVHDPWHPRRRPPLRHHQAVAGPLPQGGARCG